LNRITDLIDSQFKVTTWSPTSPFASAIPYDIYQSTIASSLPAYSLPSEKFHSLLIAPLAKVFVATSTSTSSSEAKKDDILGFALTYLIRSGSASNQALQHQKGSLALLCVSTPHQHRGIGSSLHTAALDHLNSAVKASLSLSTPIPSTSPPLQLGSIFPRIFPGIPEGPEFDDARKWFEKKGWEFQSGEQSIDLYQSLTPGLPPPELEGLMEQAEKAGITFGPLKETDDQGLIALQKAEFDSFTVSPTSPYPHPSSKKIGSSLCYGEGDMSLNMCTRDGQICSQL